MIQITKVPPTPRLRHKVLLPNDLHAGPTAGSSIKVPPTSRGWCKYTPPLAYHDRQKLSRIAQCTGRRGELGGTKTKFPPPPDWAAVGLSRTE